jgi:glycosyltransferase involved in cell wall biosynthesis
MNKINKVLYLSHPLMYQKKQKGSGWQLYIKGNLIKEEHKRNQRRKELLDYIRHFFLNIWWILKSKEKWDLYVGVDNLNAFCGIILKWLKKVNRVVYYTIDYIPQRFSNRMLDKFYHWFDIFCVKHSDIVWNLSPRMIEGRERYQKLSLKYRKKQFLVPEGVWFDRIKRYSIDRVNQHYLVYAGYLAPHLGVQKALEAIPRIIQSIRDFTFVIVGKGKYQDKLEKIAQDLNVEKYVEFKGFITDHKEVEEIISKCAIGIAPYSDDKKSFSYYADPSKIKVYMGCGLPVIMTDVFYNAKEIEDAGGGKIVNYDSFEIANAVIEMMKSQEKLREYKKNAIRYIKNFDWDIIFNSSLQKVLL